MNENNAPTDPPTDPPTGNTAEAAEDPGFSQVYQYMMFGLSLPERALRSTSALVGGALTESAGLLIPQAFRNSKSYEVFVHQMLDFMIHEEYEHLCLLRTVYRSNSQPGTSVVGKCNSSLLCPFFFC